MILCYWIRETESHPWTTMAQKAQPGNQLANWQTQMVNLIQPKKIFYLQEERENQQWTNSK